VSIDYTLKENFAMASSDIVETEGTGTVEIMVGGHKLTLKDVAYFPRDTSNLISVSCLEDDCGLFVQSLERELWSRDGKVRIPFSRVGTKYNMYVTSHTPPPSHSPTLSFSHNPLTGSRSGGASPALLENSLAHGGAMAVKNKNKKKKPAAHSGPAATPAAHSGPAATPAAHSGPAATPAAHSGPAAPPTTPPAPLESSGADLDAPAAGASKSGGASAQQSTPPALSGGAVPAPPAPEGISMEAGELSPYSLFDLTVLNEVQELVGTFNHELCATSSSHAVVQYWPSLDVAFKHVWKGKFFFANCFHLGSKVESIITKCMRD
jgi:hypothetical protein